MEILSVKTHQRNEMIDITYEIQRVLKKMNLTDGILTIYCPHTTAGITINENADPDVVQDILKKLNSLIPEHEGYRHMEGNSDAHIKSSLIGNSCQVMVEKGNLLLGTWQGVYFCEFDGPRNRNVWLK